MIAKALAEQGLVRKASSAVLPQIVEAIPTSLSFSPSRDDASFLEAYRAVSWVHVAVSAIARNGATIPFKAFKKTTKPNQEKQELLNDQRMKTLMRPFPPHLSYYQLIEWTLASLHLTGKAYWEVQPSLRNPQFIFPMRADLVRPVPDPKTYIRGYTFTVKGRAIFLAPENVFAVRFVHPQDDYDGLSPMGAAALAAATDVTAVKMNLALLNNQARPAGAFVAPGTIGDDAFQRMKLQILADFMGPTKAGKPLLLEGGLDYKAIGLPPKEMEYVRGREFTRDEIYAIYRVPPTVAGVPSANYATARVEERRFWTQAVIPPLVQLGDAIDAAFFPEEEVEVEPDLSGVPALQEELGDLTERFNKAFDRGIVTVNEVREVMGLEPVDGGELRYQPAIMVPVQTDLLDEEPPATPGMEEEPPDRRILLEPEEEMLQLLAKASRALEGTVQEEKERRKALWVEKDLNRQKEERQFSARIAEEFRGQFRRVQKAVKTWFTDHPDEFPPVAMLFDRDKEVKRFADAGLRFFTAAYVEFKRRGIAFAERMGFRRQPEVEGEAKQGTEVIFDLVDENAREFLRTKAFKFSPLINATTEEELRATLLEGFDAGESIGALQERVRQVFEGTIRANAGRALAIARTEMTSVGGRGTMDGYLAAGARTHEWLSAGDENVRQPPKSPYDHAIDGEEVTIGSRFSNGLVHPGDPTGDPGNIIACRCDTLPVREESGE